MNDIECAVCGGIFFTSSKVLWDALVSEWEIDSTERDYIDRQQGMRCDDCGCNIRSQALAKSITTHWNFEGLFNDFIRKFSKLRVLEINTASDLTRWFEKMPHRQLAEYPEVDIQQMPFEKHTFDLIVHSDTLEHIENPVRALEECRRILRPTGLLAYTVPVIVGRLSRSRQGMSKSYHGFPDTGADDYLVQTEYGADMWIEPIAAGFKQVSIQTFDYPSGIAVSASDGVKKSDRFLSKIIRSIKR